MKQTYYCNHCGINCDSIFSVFLHIFTDHMHTDIGLEKAEARVLVGQTEPYRVRVMFSGQTSADQVLEQGVKPAVRS